MSYDYVMALEHINSITNLRAIIEHKFKGLKQKQKWWPLGLGLSDLNLIYCINVQK